MIVNFSLEFDDKGKVVIRLPEGVTKKMNADKIAALTEKIAKSLGTITERHIGHPHVHLDNTGETHLHQEGN